MKSSEVLPGLYTYIHTYYIQLLYSDSSAFQTQVPDHFCGIGLGFQIHFTCKHPTVNHAIPNGSCYFTLQFCFFFLDITLNTCAYQQQIYHTLEYYYIPCHKSTNISLLLFSQHWSLSVTIYVLTYLKITSKNIFLCNFPRN